ncbi:MAG: futalosine hydrolase [Ginsengibacter sp.]
MNLLLVSATEFELKPFLAGNEKVDVLITGIGIPNTIYHLTKKLAKKNYDLVIQAGIAGSFNEQILKGSVVMVKQDTFGDVGMEEKENFKTLFEAGFAQANDFPFRNGWLLNENKYLLHQTLPTVESITVNKITDDKKLIKRIVEKFRPDIESMEGAAFHFVCLHQKVNFLQLRSISNVVGDRDKENWQMKDAIENLSIELKKILNNFI